jgi:hypothetical protein
MSDLSEKWWKNNQNRVKSVNPAKLRECQSRDITSEFIRPLGSYRTRNNLGLRNRVLQVRLLPGAVSLPAIEIMKVTRIYADERGESHFADSDFALHDAGPIGHLSQPIPARCVVFRTNKPAIDQDWHVAPQRQFVVLLDGEIDIEVSDGSRRTFAGGDVLLVEDTTGKGHRTRNVGQCERRSLFIVLDEA